MRQLFTRLALCALPGCTVLVDAQLHDSDRAGDDAGRDGTTLVGDAGTGAPEGGAGVDGPGGTTGSVGPDATGMGLPKLSLGMDHGCGLRANGTITCWGSNLQEQRTLPTDRRYRDLAAGWNHTCALDERGALVCVGRNTSGQRASAAGPFKQVVAGEEHTCALDSSSHAQCWGDQTFEQSEAPASAFSAISAGRDFNCGIRAADANVECWGNGAGQLSAALRGTRFRSLSGGHDQMCGITEQGIGHCWTALQRAPVNLGEVRALAVGKAGRCALLGDGAIRCWAGGGTFAFAMERAPFVSLAVGGKALCGLPKTGALLCESEGDMPAPVNFP